MNVSPHVLADVDQQMARLTDLLDQLVGHASHGFRMGHDEARITGTLVLTLLESFDNHGMGPIESLFDSVRLLARAAVSLAKVEDGKL